MSNITTTTPPLAAATMEKVLLGGDLQLLQPAERLSYYGNLCESGGFNPMFRPFDYLLLNNKLVLYMNKGGGEQLRQIRKVSIEITAREKIGDVYVVTARAKLPDGRVDESTGAVDVAGKRGEGLANQYMKAETKAKRRVTLSICGMNMLDETEVDSIDGAKRLTHDEVERMPAAQYVDRTPPPDVASGPTSRPQPAGASASPALQSPWDYCLPKTWKRNGGASLRDLGVDGVSSTLEWLSSLESLTPTNKEIKAMCEAALKVRQDGSGPITVDADFEAPDFDTDLDNALRRNP